MNAGDKNERTAVIKRLVGMQYERHHADFRRGVFRVRGDTIDIFPAENADLAVRIELADDVIEALFLFDPLTGRRRRREKTFYSLSFIPLCCAARYGGAGNARHQRRIGRTP